MSKIFKINTMYKKTLTLSLMMSLVIQHININAADAPKLMTYQGHLLDANGKPVGQDAPQNKTIVFYIYDAEEGGNTIWGEEQTVTVDNGYFSVILGEGTTVSGENIFADMNPSNEKGNMRYIGMTVDGVDITPRLRLLTNPYSQFSQYAVSSKNAEIADKSKSADSLANNTTARGGFGFVPVGGIIMWNNTTIPKGWQICDGTNKTPNLQGRFVLGVGSSSGKHGDYAWKNSETLGRTGGHKNVRILETHMPSHNHSIHNKDIGNHSHTANTSYAGNHYHEQGHPPTNNTKNHYAWFGVGRRANVKGKAGHEADNSPEGNEYLPRTSTNGNHRHSLKTSSAGSSRHNHGMSKTGGNSGIENRPPFYALYYIQRIQ